MPVMIHIQDFSGVEMFINANYIMEIEPYGEDGSMITFQNNRSLHVKENPVEIDDLIDISIRAIWEQLLLVVGRV